MTRPRIGSLCSGYGGLDMAVEAVTGGRTVWVCDNAPGPAAVLAHRWPNTPNHGDMTTTDWATVEPVDVVAAGFPCQPVSHAGRRAGIHDERWLFGDVIRCIVGTRARLLVCENVPGLLTANNGDAMARVVEGLAAVGWVGRWRTVAAADIGAPHRRQRVFIVAHPAHTDSDRRSDLLGARLRPQPPRDGADADPDTPHQRPDRTFQSRGRRHRSTYRGGGATADPSGVRREERQRPAPRQAPGGRPQCRDQRRGRDAVDWGPYRAAVERWEHLTGPAPDPTIQNHAGDGRRLSPMFVEWMMGLPPGWVTAVPGLTYGGQLHLLGNGVVPQQAEHALRWLLTDVQEAAAWA